MRKLRWFVFFGALWSAVTLQAAERFIFLGGHRVHPTRILARFHDGAARQRGQAALQSAGMGIVRQFSTVEGLVVLEVRPNGRVGLAAAVRNAATPEDAILQRLRVLKASGLFRYVQPNYVYTHQRTPNDFRFEDGTLWGLRNTVTPGMDIGAEAAWDVTTGSTNVVVAVVDTGIRATHRDLARQMWRNPKEIAGNGVDDDGNGYVDDVFGIDAAENDGDPDDGHYHGTHVAGTIGAAANDDGEHVGVAWQVRLMAGRFLGSDGFGYTDGAIECVNYAVANGARVINASFGGAPFEQAMFDTIDAAREAGVLFVAAAGNESTNSDVTPAYPASYAIENVISVAAIDRYGALAEFSNYGLRRVHLGAPGVEIFSCGSANNSAYRTLQGTSMAAPHVAGVAALLVAQFPGISVSDLRERLLSTVVPTPSLTRVTSTGGRVNAAAALAAKPDGILNVGVVPASGTEVASGGSVLVRVTVTDLGPVGNATVTALVEGESELVTFRNDGVAPDLTAGDSVYAARVAVPVGRLQFSVDVSVSAPEKTALSTQVTYSILSKPVNDAFSDATEIPSDGGRYEVNNKLASKEPGEPAHDQIRSTDVSVWWRWVPASSTRAIVDTTGSTFDTVVAVYTNSTLGTLRGVVSADDPPGPTGNNPSKKQGYVSFSAVAGTPYYVVVAGYSALDVGLARVRVEPNGGVDVTPPTVNITSPLSGLVLTNAADNRLVVTGTAEDPMPNSSGLKQVLIRLNSDLARSVVGLTNWTSTSLLEVGRNTIQVIASDFAGNSFSARQITVTYRPVLSPNDQWSQASVLVGSSGNVEGNNTQATREPGEPLHAGESGGRSVWYSYAPDSDGVLTLATEAAPFDTVLGLYQGDRVENLVELTSNNNGSAVGTASRLEQPLKGGQRYWIAVDGVSRSSGTFRLRYEFTPEPVVALAVQVTEGGSVTPSTGLFRPGQRLILTAVPVANFVFDRWEGSLVSQENPLSLVLQNDVALTARFRAQRYAEDFETGGFSRLAWENVSATPWLVQREVVAAGSFAARSGSIGDGQNTVLKLAQNCRAGVGSFQLRVSTERIWDTLSFFVNGTRVGRWSGEIAWTNVSFNVLAGLNTLEWRYAKDTAPTRAGLDAVFIDNLDLPIQLVIDATTPGRLSLERLVTGQMQLRVTGQAEQTYDIEGSTDLLRWQVLSSGVANGGTIRYIDSPGATTPVRFYRAVVR